VQQDYYLNDFSLSAMDEQGHLQHRLQAKQLSHFTAGEKTELQQPELMVFKQDKVAWQVVAERGEINQRQDDILLLGGVQLNQLTGNEPLRLTTSSLHILPKQGRANTNQPITLTQAGKRIDAIGMEIEREGQRLLLLSQVRGRYETLVH
jgi:lipopolysaccharide export system protein LptC